MPSPIVSRDRIKAEFDRVKATTYEFSDAELCAMVAAQFPGMSLDTVTAICLNEVQESAT